MITIMCPDLKRIQQDIYGKKLNFRKSLDKALEKSFLKAARTARAFYDMTNDPSGLTDLTVLPFKNGQADYSLVASGRSVVFLEFGAGWTVATGEPYANEMPFPVVPASWSIHDKRQFFKHGQWTYRGQVYDRVFPTRAMFMAAQELKLDIATGEWLRDEVTGL